MLQCRFKNLLSLFLGANFVLLLFFVVNAEEINLSAKVEGNSKGPILFFIHGSPGSAESFSDYFQDEELKKNAQLVAIDRPGFGETTKKLSKLSVSEQAQLFTKYIAEKYPGREVILVGHSYGAPVAAQMAALPEAKYKSIILMSPIADPKEVKRDVVIKTLKALKPTYPAVEKVTPAKYQHLFTSPTELSNLEKDLGKMSESWKNIRAKIILVNGEKDKRVSYANIDFINKNVDKNNLPEVRIIPDEGHSLPKSGNLEVKDILLREVTTTDHSLGPRSSTHYSGNFIPRVSKKRCESLFSQIYKAKVP